MPRHTAQRKKTATQKAEVLEVTPDIVIHEREPETQQEEDENVQASTSGQQAASTSQPSTSTCPPPRVLVPKKPYRVSHKEIVDYKFTQDQLQILRDFIKNHPCLYVKTHRDYSNHKTKSDLWHECAELFDECTHLQCRKYFEQKRTAFGKIEAQEMRSGAAARERTAREEVIMENWDFLKGHIAHSNTTSSQGFTSPNESSSASESGLSAASIERRKKKKRTEDVTSASSQDVTAEAVQDPQPDVDITEVRRLIEVATTLSNKHESPWVGTEIEHFTKMIGYQVHALHPDDQRDAMMGALSFVHEFETKRKKSATAQPPTVQPAPVVQPPVQPANPGQPPNVPPPPVVQPPVQPANPGQPPNVQASPVQYANPATPGAGWIYVPPPRPITPSTVYHLPPQQPMPYGVPSTSAYQHTYGPPPVVPPNSMQPTQPSNCGGYVPAATTTSLTSLQTVSSPTNFIQHIESLPSLTPLMAPTEKYSTNSTLHTPEGDDDYAEDTT